MPKKLERKLRAPRGQHRLPGRVRLIGAPRCAAAKPEYAHRPPLSYSSGAEVHTSGPPDFPRGITSV